MELPEDIAPRLRVVKQVSIHHTPPPLACDMALEGDMAVRLMYKLSMAVRLMYKLSMAVRLMYKLNMAVRLMYKLACL